MSNHKADQELDQRLVKFFADGLQYQFYRSDDSDLDGTVKGAVDKFPSDTHRGRVVFVLWQFEAVRHPVLSFPACVWSSCSALSPPQSTCQTLFSPDSKPHTDPAQLTIQHSSRTPRHLTLTYQLIPQSAASTGSPKGLRFKNQHLIPSHRASNLVSSALFHTTSPPSLLAFHLPPWII